MADKIRKFIKDINNTQYLIDNFIEEEDYEEDISKMNVLDSRMLNKGEEDNLVYEDFLKTCKNGNLEIIDILSDRIIDEWEDDHKFERAMIIIQIIYANRIKEVMYSQSKTIEMNSSLKWLNKMKKGWGMESSRK